MTLQLGYCRRADGNIESAIICRESRIRADGVNGDLMLASRERSWRHGVGREVQTCM